MLKCRLHDRFSQYLYNTEIVSAIFRLKLRNREGKSFTDGYIASEQWNQIDSNHFTYQLSSIVTGHYLY